MVCPQEGCGESSMGVIDVKRIFNGKLYIFRSCLFLFKIFNF